MWNGPLDQKKQTAMTGAAKCVAEAVSQVGQSPCVS